MSEQQANCAATQRKLLINDIWSDLTSLEKALGDSIEFAHAITVFADKLDHKDPIQRVFIHLAYHLQDAQNDNQAAFIRLTNRINQLREVA